MVASPENFPLLDELLAEQNRLDTPVARFSSAHDAGLLSPSPAHHAKLPAPAAQLIPLTAPRPGEQYAFEVDLDSCSGCKSCVAACHSLNGLDDTETWRDVGLLVSPDRARPLTQTVTTACHHCADPACLNGCPVLAYEKDPVTGIVRHLDDQCIGCSYCILKCPYDVPKFSTRLGIVRKCDMCHSRLSAGEAPACAQACPTQAIKIVTVIVDRTPRPASTTASGDEAALPAFLPGAPAPDYTRPTTRYTTRRTLPASLVAADAATLRPQPAHWPLVAMLTLMPAAVGLALAAAFVPQTGAGLQAISSILPNYSSLGSAPAAASDSVTHYVTLSSWLLGTAGLVASGFHLGQPLRAWRIFLGWRRSWLSREAMVFGAWFGAATAALVFPSLVSVSAVIGVTGLACSAMIYVDTRRYFWRATQTFPRFLGAAAIFAVTLWSPPVAALVLLVKIAWESRAYYDRSVSARLQRGPLAAATCVRDALAVITIVLLIIAPGWMALPTLLAGELAERYLFFRAVDAPKMPGSPA